MSSSREQILSRLRQRDLPPAELPPEPMQGIIYDDPISQFTASLQFVGGQAVEVEAGKWREHIEQTPVYQEANKIVSVLPDLPGGVDLDAVDDPHLLEDIDLFIAPGEFAVAENGAIWVTDRNVKHRVLYFINQHMILKVSASQIISNMHQAYQRMSLGANEFGVFISGPSKTADIEQALVIGAHGARSLTVLIERE